MKIKINHWLTIVLLVVIGDLAWCSWLWLVPLLQQNHTLVKADAVVILHAESTAEAPGPETQRRLQHGLELYSQGLANHVICSGGWRPTVLGAEVMRDWLLQKGLPAENCLVEKQSNSTLSNLKNTFAMCEINEWRNIILVSSAPHLWRTQALLDSLNHSTITVQWSPWIYSSASPRPSLLSRWVEAHYEACAWLVSVMPESWQQQLVGWLRGQPE